MKLNNVTTIKYKIDFIQTWTYPLVTIKAKKNGTGHTEKLFCAYYKYLRPWTTVWTKDVFEFFIYYFINYFLDRLCLQPFSTLK